MPWRSVCDVNEVPHCTGSLRQRFPDWTRNAFRNLICGLHLDFAELSLYIKRPPHFFLSPGSGHNGDSGTETDSSSSSEVLVLLPADSTNNRDFEFDDNDVPLDTDIMLRNRLDDDDDEPLRDLLWYSGD